MGTVHKMPQKGETDKLIDAMFQELPAHSRKEIATKLTKRLGRKVTIGSVSTALAHLRKNSYEYGWTVPHAQKGQVSEEARKRYRYFHVLVEKGREPEFDTGHEIELNNGLMSTVAHAATSLMNEYSALVMAAQYCRSASAKKWIRSLARRTKSLAEDARDVVELMRDESGDAA